MKHHSIMGYDLDEVREEIHRYPKLTANDLCASLVDEMIQIRRNCGYSQRKLGSLCGVEQSVVTRMESGTTTPNLRTALNLLAQMGRTLRIVDLKDVEVQCGGRHPQMSGGTPPTGTDECASGDEAYAESEEVQAAEPVSP